MEVLANAAYAGASKAEMSRELARECDALRKEACETWSEAIDDPQHASSQLRAQLRRVSDSSAGNAGTIALAAAYVGDTSLALDALEVLTAKASTPTFQNMWFPLLSNVRKEARFKRLMSDLGFVELWRRTDQWPDFCHPTGVDDFECT